jgi:ERCC4-type nuclease
MILVDYRIGSKDLAAPLRRLGSEVSLTTLEYGDLACFGHGPDGNVDIGIERKVLSDLLSSLQSGRLLGHQLPGLTRIYDYPYLLIEGIWRAGREGVLETPRRGGWVAAGFGRRTWLYGDLVRLCASISVLAGVTMLYTSNAGETAQMMHALEAWWDKPWGAHKSLKAIHATPAPRALLRSPSTTQTIAAQLPGVGWEYSEAVEAAFESVAGMVGAGVGAWAEVRMDGTTKAGHKRPKLGTKRAERIVNTLRGG